MVVIIVLPCDQKIAHSVLIWWSNHQNLTIGHFDTALILSRILGRLQITSPHTYSLRHRLTYVCTHCYKLEVRRLSWALERDISEHWMYVTEYVSQRGFLCHIIQQRKVIKSLEDIIQVILNKIMYSKGWALRTCNFSLHWKLLRTPIVKDVYIRFNLFFFWK